ncbi:MAG: CDP-glycerol glycerophosphotransferase family protein [Methanobacteriaceae archaeon]
MNIKAIIKKIARNFIIILYLIFYRFIPVQDNVIIFESSVGRNYSGNPRYIYEEIVKQGFDKKFKCVWFLEDISIEIPGNVLKVQRPSFKFFYYFAVAKIWIIDSRHPKWVRKRDNVTYIQTWHGTPLKKLALDMDYLNMGGNTDIKTYHSDFKNNSALWDYLIAQNQFSADIFKRAFAFNKEILTVGYPRNDILINKNNEKDINEIKERFNIPKDKKIILYAPTWRDNSYHQEGYYKFSTKMDYDLMKNELEKEGYILILKYHYLVKENIDWSSYNGFIYDCNEKWDIQELYLIADVLITDYSSVMFDYSVLKKPMIFFTYDLEEYKDELRGFYFDLIEEAPGDIVKTNKQLIESIKKASLFEYENKYKDKYNKFYEKFSSLEDGKAGAKVVDLILEKIKT